MFININVYTPYGLNVFHYKLNYNLQGLALSVKLYYELFFTHIFYDLQFAGQLEQALHGALFELTWRKTANGNKEYEEFKNFVRDYLKICRQYPNAKIFYYTSD